MDFKSVGVALGSIGAVAGLSLLRTRGSSSLSEERYDVRQPVITQKPVGRPAYEAELENLDFARTRNLLPDYVNGMSSSLGHLADLLQRARFAKNREHYHSITRWVEEAVVRSREKMDKVYDLLHEIELQNAER